MSCIIGFVRFFGVYLLVLQVGWADEAGWDERLARMFSFRFREIQGDLRELASQVEVLPGIPLDDQGGTGGDAGIYESKATPVDPGRTVDVRWAASAQVDLIALVPARRYATLGLDAQYGMPGAFTVELINAAGEVVRCVARERNTRAHLARKGHPFVYELSPAVAAVGLRISGDLLNPDSEHAETFVQAWAEVLVFEGERNVALGGAVASRGGGALPAPWHWSPEFLVDGQTPLGLPEVPAEAHGNIGWISEGRARANESASLIVDLGESVEIDAVRLLPAQRLTSDLPSGFGFPRKLAILSSGAGEAGAVGQWTLIAERELRNPGHNPVLVSFGKHRARYLKIEAVELWKAFDNYPAFFALSEVEVLAAGKNLALGKLVRSVDGMENLIASGGRYWSAAALSDGFGPEGRLVSTRQWLLKLDQRLCLETRSHELQDEANHLVSGWRRAGLAGIAALGLLGSFLIIALPIRYRIHANRELLKVRERIAGDLHDEVGSNLGSIQMFADLAEGRSGPSDELKRIQRIAAETVSAVRDIVWLLRPEGDHRIGTVEHLRETSSIMLETLEWKFIANEEAWQVELADEQVRHLFLFFREALHNIIRHARAAKVIVRVEKMGREFRLAIADDGLGIADERLERPATLRALRQRAAALEADFKVDSRVGEGTRLMLIVPLARKRSRKQAGAAAAVGNL